MSPARETIHTAEKRQIKINKYVAKNGRHLRFPSKFIMIFGRKTKWNIEFAVECVCSLRCKRAESASRQSTQSVWLDVCFVNWRYNFVRHLMLTGTHVLHRIYIYCVRRSSFVSVHCSSAHTHTRILLHELRIQLTLLLLFPRYYFFITPRVRIWWEHFCKECQQQFRTHAVYRFVALLLHELSGAFFVLFWATYDTWMRSKKNMKKMRKTNSRNKLTSYSTHNIAEQTHVHRVSTLWRNNNEKNQNEDREKEWGKNCVMKNNLIKTTCDSRYACGYCVEIKLMKTWVSRDTT